VQARLDLWLKAHLEKLLGPLFALASAEDITGIARGIAFQLTEALGVLERHRVAEEVKGLEQAARATLRKYGVRFGAYHLYLPNLLKPGPRALAIQLWALKEATPETKGLDEVPHLAASGRTSFPADKDVPKALYRVVGYRVCGERAVRVDILERLADLIRPALAWRAGSPAPKPPGAVEGGGFAVTVNMTSLTGSSGEDFASVLRSLGYRMEKKAKSKEAAPPTPIAQAALTETSPEASAASETVATAETASLETPVEAATAPAAEVASEPIAAPAEPSAAIEAAPEMPVATAVAPVAPEVPAETAPDAEPAEAADAKPDEPEMIEVWRPGRPPEERRQRPPRPQGERRERHGQRPDRRPRSQVAAPQDGIQAAAPAADATAPAPAEAGEAKPAPHQDRPRQGRGNRGGRGDRPEQHEGRPPPRERRGGERPDRDRTDRPDRPRREGRRDFKDRDRGEPREWIDPKERRGQADPNSPFAKLAALKEQLEAGKEKR
jgi:ATP-dependent RNA helicase SUPV3L1/SUV3